jgi:16S rRNA (cytidine1402-2'-O)-methyltransferase
MRADRTLEGGSTGHTGGVTEPAPGRLDVVGPPPRGSEPSARAIEVLGSASRVWWEDVPQVVDLLEAAAVPLDRRSPIEAGSTPAAVVAAVAGGAAVAVVGTGPTVAPTVGAVVDAGLPVEVVPAPDPAVVALVASGLATDHVAVQRTLPADGELRTIALPVPGADLVATLAELVEVCGPDRPVAVAAGAGADGETWRGSVAAVAAWAATREPAGDVVLVVGGAPAVPAVVDHGDEAVREALRAARARGLSPGRAAAEVAAALGRTRREVYALGAEDET